MLYIVWTIGVGIVRSLGTLGVEKWLEGKKKCDDDGDGEGEGEGRLGGHGS